MMWPFNKKPPTDAGKILETLDAQQRLTAEQQKINEEIRAQVLELARRRTLIGESLIEKESADASDD